jgi:hypothetical protein
LTYAFRGRDSLHVVYHSLLVGDQGLAQVCGFSIFGLLIKVLDGIKIFKDLKFFLLKVLHFLMKNVIG